MPAPRPIAVRDTRAAAMLDLPAAEFRKLVRSGALPPPVPIAPGVERWRVADLEAILDGRAARPPEMEDFEL